MTAPTPNEEQREGVQTPGSRVSEADSAPVSRSNGHHTLIIMVTLMGALASYVLTRSLLNEMAARALAIFIIASVFWATEALPTFATAFVVLGLNIVLLAETGGLAEPITHMLMWLGLTVRLPDAVSSLHSSIFLPLGKDIILLFLGGFLLSEAMTKHGLDRIIASHILRPFMRSPLSLLYGVLGISAFFSMWMSNTATASMMLAITIPFIDRVPQESRFRSALLMAVAFGANIGGIGTPIGTPPNAIAYGALNAAGYKVTFLRWMLLAVPLEILLLAGVGILLYILYRPEQTLHFQLTDAADHISMRGKVTLTVLCITIVLWLTSGQHGMHAGAIALLAAAALSALGMLNREDISSIDWDIIILMWGGLSLGIAMQKSGLIGYLNRFDMTLLPGDGWAVAFVVALIGMGVSTFMSNTATAALLVPMAFGLSLPGTAQYVILAALACSFGMAMPVSTPPNAIVFATGWLPVREMIRTGSLISIVAVALMLLGYQIMMPLIF